MNDPQHPSDADPWLPDQPEQDSSLSPQPPVVPDDIGDRPKVARQPVSPWLDEPEITEPEPEFASNRTWLWCRHNPTFLALLATGIFGLVGAIAVVWNLTATLARRDIARPAQPVHKAVVPHQPPAGQMPVDRLGPVPNPQQDSNFHREVDALFARNKSFDFDFELTDTDGKSIAMADFRGKVLVVVDVWGTWCPPCRREIPHFVALQQKFEEAGLAIVGLNSERVRDQQQALTLVQDFRRKNAMNYRCALVNRDTLQKIPAFNAFPTTMFFDRNGNVRAKVVGYHDYGKLEIIVRKLLDEKIDGAEDSRDSKKMSRPSSGVPGLVRRSSWPIAEQGGGQGHYWASAFSPDGQTYMAFGDSGPRGVICLWDLATGKPSQELRTEKDVWFHYARFLPNGEQVVSAYSNDKNLYLWEVHTGQLVHEFQGHAVNGVTAFVSHDGRRLVSVGLDKTLRLWNVAPPQEVWTQDVSGEQIAEVAFSPDDQSILTSGADRILRIRQLESGAVVARMEGHGAGDVPGSFHPDGEQVLSWGGDGQVRLWDVSTARTLHVFEGRADAVRKAWHLEGGRQVLIWGKDLMFQVRDTASGRKLREFAVAQTVPPGWSEATVSPDGRRLLVVNSDGDDVRLVDINSGEESYRSERGKLPTARGFSFSPDGRYVAAGSFRTGVYLVQLPDPTAESSSPTNSRAAG